MKKAIIFIVILLTISSPFNASAKGHSTSLRIVHFGTVRALYLPGEPIEWVARIENAAPSVYPGGDRVFIHPLCGIEFPEGTSAFHTLPLLQPGQSTELRWRMQAVGIETPVAMAEIRIAGYKEAATAVAWVAKDKPVAQLVSRMLLLSIYETSLGTAIVWELLTRKGWRRIAASAPPIQVIASALGAPVHTSVLNRARIERMESARGKTLISLQGSVGDTFNARIEISVDTHLNTATILVELTAKRPSHLFAATLLGWQPDVSSPRVITEASLLPRNVAARFGKLSSPPLMLRWEDSNLVVGWWSETAMVFDGMTWSFRPQVPQKFQPSDKLTLRIYLLPYSDSP